MTGRTDRGRTTATGRMTGRIDAQRTKTATTRHEGTNGQRTDDDDATDVTSTDAQTNQRWVLLQGSISI